MWTAEADPCVLRARVSFSTGVCAAAIDLSLWPHCALPGDGCVHVRLHLPDGVLRLDLVDSANLAGPLMIEPAIDLRRGIDSQIESLRRLHALMRGDVLETRDQRFVRLIEALRVADAIAAGASLRDIGLGAFGDDWPGDGEHLKSRVRRRVELAAELMRAGPVGVLAGKI